MQYEPNARHKQAAAEASTEALAVSADAEITLPSTAATDSQLGRARIICPRPSEQIVDLSPAGRTLDNWQAPWRLCTRWLIGVASRAHGRIRTQGEASEGRPRFQKVTWP